MTTKLIYTWQEYLNTILVSVVTSIVILFTIIIVIDPNKQLAFSPDFARGLVNQNARFIYPGLAQNSVFDSAIFGNSTIRLLRPGKLNKTIGGRFVNLSMNAATAYEQSKIFNVFITSHAHPNTLVFGIDSVWCQPRGDIETSTPDFFPEWIYDSDPWNDLLHIFNIETLRQTIRQIQYWIGNREPKYGPDGYADFTQGDVYELSKAQEKIYKNANSNVLENNNHSPLVDNNIVQANNFPALSLLHAMLDQVPQSSRKILVIVPYHVYLQTHPQGISKQEWIECKQKINQLVEVIPNSYVIDFMIPSAITKRDDNYWDQIHYTTSVANQLVDYISYGIKNNKKQKGVFKFYKSQR